MSLISTRTFAALLLSTSLFACTVGETSTGRPTGADAGANVVDNPDATEEEVTELKWSPTTMDVTGIKAAMHYVSDDEIYAVIGEKICIWNGSVWADHTPVAIGLATTMAFVTPNEIYSVIGNQLAMYDGSVWTLLGQATAGLNSVGTAEIHYAGVNEIYAVILEDGGLSSKICMWNGTAWVDMTLGQIGMKFSMVAMPGGIFYAVVGTKICKWTGILGELGAWVEIAPEIENLRPAIQVVSDTEMYAVIGTQICKWDGLAWSIVTDEMTGLHVEFMRTSDEDIKAVAGSAVIHWAPVAVGS